MFENALAPAPPHLVHDVRLAVSVGAVDTTPILDSKLITTAETAYKAKHQPRIPLMLGSNSADTAGNRIRATTKEHSSPVSGSGPLKRKPPTIPMERPNWPRW
jgi:hypothetical protein